MFRLRVVVHALPALRVDALPDVSRRVRTRYGSVSRVFETSAAPMRRASEVEAARAALVHHGVATSTVTVEPQTKAHRIIPL